jgi:hypothetical protein
MRNQQRQRNMHRLHQGTPHSPVTPQHATIGASLHAHLIGTSEQVSEPASGHAQRVNATSMNVHRPYLIVNRRTHNQQVTVAIRVVQAVEPGAAQTHAIYAANTTSPSSKLLVSADSIVSVGARQNVRH